MEIRYSLRPCETRNLLFLDMIFRSFKIVFIIKKINEKYHLAPSSSVMGTIVGWQSVFNTNLLKIYMIFLKYENFWILMKIINLMHPTGSDRNKNSNQKVELKAPKEPKSAIFGAIFE